MTTRSGIKLAYFRGNLQNISPQIHRTLPRLPVKHWHLNHHRNIFNSYFQPNVWLPQDLFFCLNHQINQLQFLLQDKTIKRANAKTFVKTNSIPFFYVESSYRIVTTQNNNNHLSDGKFDNTYPNKEVEIDSNKLQMKERRSLNKLDQCSLQLDHLIWLY